MIQKLQHKYALSHQGAIDMIKAFVSCTFSYLVLMLPVGLLYYFIKDLFDGISINGGKMAFYIIGIIVCLLLVVITTYVQYNKTFFATYKESGIRRISISEKLRKLPLSFFSKKDLADLTSTIMADSATLETASSHWIPELVGSMISTVIISISLFFFDWRLALAALWVLPVSFAVVFFSGKYINRKQTKQNEAKMAFADGIQECLESIRDLKANNAQDDYMKGLDKKIKNVEKSTIITELNNAIFNGSARLILKLGIATVALVGSILLTNGKLDPLIFFVFLIAVSRIYDPLTSSLDNLSGVIALRVPVKRMNGILEHQIQTGAEKLDNIGTDIQFENVKFSYHDKEVVLKNVSFTAKQGEVTALIGPSGGGKTTVSRLASRFWDVSEGKITIGGMDINKVDPEVLMSLYSIVFQDVTLFNNTVMENIRIGKMDATDEEVIKAAKLAHCEEFVEKMPNKWNSFIGENGSELSGGERQRLSIARAFLKDAPIILLDEATASLDVDNESLIQESLSKLIENKTVLIIAHRMRTISGADKIVVLKEGIVIEEGSPSKLIKTKGIYSSMVKAQTDSQQWKM